MKNKIRSFFFPPEGAKTWRKVLPYAILGLLTLVVLVSVNYAWDYTNSSVFCGTACHTMPPEYSTYQVSPHARVQCVECHIGRDVISTQFIRKAGDLRHVYLNITQQFEYPIKATRMRPSEDACETCHFPEKFSDDSLREIINFDQDEFNTKQKIILIMKTGGGTAREGLGFGIHWHVENQVDFYAVDSDEQEIPYIRVVNADGEMKEFVDISSGFNTDDIQEEDLTRMDCITCHNRITHNIPKPEEIVSQAMGNDLIPSDLPFAAQQAIEALYIYDDDKAAAMEQIDAFADFYRTNYPDVYTERGFEIDEVVEFLRGVYDQYVFPDQNFFWDTHSNNLGHKDDPGCFRCHDGQHFTEDLEVVRLECNICHAIPVVINEGDLVTNIEIVSGPEPPSHMDSYWIPIHSKVINITCATCHDMGNIKVSEVMTEKPEASDSFCGNEACHSSEWSYLGYDDPEIQEILDQQIEKYIGIKIAPVDTSGEINFENVIGPMLGQYCSACHNSEGSSGGLDLTTYEALLLGGNSGPAFNAGDPEGSLLIIRQSMETDHYGQLSLDDLDIIRQWIMDGAAE